MYSQEQKIFWSALLSRIFVIFVSFLSNEFIIDHDPDVFKTPAASEDFTILDNIIHRILGGLLRWDAQYFIHIAKYGYTYEKCLAFFPLFPFMTKVVSAILYCFVSSVLNYSSVTLLCAVLLNICFFVKAANTLYRLTLTIFNDKQLAYKSAIFFTINPASIFFTAPYSESSFAFFTFMAILLGTENKLNESSIFTGLSIATRSNGILNIGFIIYRHLKYILPKYKNSLPLLVLHSVLLIVRVLVACASFIMFQAHGYFRFCFLYIDSFTQNVIAYGEENDFVISGQSISPWCKSAVPIPYSYIQDHYWQVGFLKYYEWKQLPNFLLATPVVCIIIYNSYNYLKENRRCIFSLGLKNKYFKSSHDNKQFEYIVHILLLTIFCVLCIHVQVTTRMVSTSSPVLYWIAARTFKSRYKSKSVLFERQLQKISTTNDSKLYKIESVENMNSVFKTFVLTESCENCQQRLIKLYFITYLILGTVLFSNYYPWT